MTQFPLTEAALKFAVTATEAKKLGYSILAGTYIPTEHEREMLERALKTLDGRRYLLVSRIDGHDIYIPKSDKL